MDGARRRLVEADAGGDLAEREQPLLDQRLRALAPRRYGFELRDELVIPQSGLRSWFFSRAV